VRKSFELHAFSPAHFATYFARFNMVSYMDVSNNYPILISSGNQFKTSQIRPCQVAIVSYGTGNLASLEESFAAIGAEAYLAANPDDLSRADALVLPGVGHFGTALSALHDSEFLLVLRHLILAGVPTLGICLGFHLLTKASEESAGMDGLGLLPFVTELLRPHDTIQYKVPHMGWNNISKLVGESILLKDISHEKQIFYYSNSYGVPASSDLCFPHACFEHDQYWLAILEKDNIFGVQFHPEKSRSQGLQVLRNFLSRVNIL